MIELENYITIEEFFYEKDDVVNPHASIWGDFNFCLNGILEYEIDGHTQLSPPSYGIWIPSRTTHHCKAIEQIQIHYVAIRFHPNLCQHFSKNAEILGVSFFLKTLVEEVLSFKVDAKNLNIYRNLLQVLLDQLIVAPKYNHYLPQSHHPVLKEVLKKLSSPKNLACSLHQLISQAPITERHLLRLCQQELNMTISEWRNRAKILYAIAQLRQGESIKKIGYDLGYNHSSSFIEFFKRYTDQTPNQLKSS